MKQIQLVPDIYEYSSFEQFNETFQLNEKDLILTNAYIIEPIKERMEIVSPIILQEKYGSGEPSDTMVNSILAEAAKYDYNRVIAIGGGSILDISKIIVVANGRTIVDDLYDDMANLKTDKELIAIPTTCGTGSEVTNIAIVNRTKLGTKQGLVSPAMFPTHGVLISEFMNSLPYKVFATSSIDALIHSVESYLSPLATSYTEMFSKAAMKDILLGYVEVAKDKENAKKLGGQFLKAANYAGIAFGNAGCGPVHAMSYALGGKYHVAHGESNYQFFLPVLYFYKEKKPEGKIQQLEQYLAEILNCEDGLLGLKELLEQILPAKPMHEYGATMEDIAPFTQSTVDNQQRLLGRTYCPITFEDIYNIFKNCL